ncbi:MAG: ComF family protein [Clostridia bacterium]|nr:ComF family protein [Clostridia bacterium]
MGVLRNLLFPPRCAACRKLLPFDGAGGEHIMCLECRGAFEAEKIKLCRMCGSLMMDCRCMPDMLGDVGCAALVKLASYRAADLRGVINKIVNNNKRYKYNESFEFAARQLLPCIGRSLDERQTQAENVIVSFCPRSRRAYRQNGFDQAQMLAQYIAALGGFTCERLLSRRRRDSSQSQKKLGFEARATNVRGAIMLSCDRTLEGKTVLLVDDVVTSGATMSACVSLLLGAGAAAVIGVCIAAAKSENR